MNFEKILSANMEALYAGASGETMATIGDLLNAWRTPG